MSPWVPGAVLLAAGLVWIAVRVTIEKKAVTGSWLSTLIRELAVIQQIPIIGRIWRLLPVLLVVAGILWLVGVRPPGMGGGESSDSSTLCGVDSSRPDAISKTAWSSYECAGESDAGDHWGQCLSRSKYTSEPGRGCPGAQRCCPPR